METFKRLEETALRQNNEGAFPDWLLTEVLSIVAAPQQYQAQLPLIETFIQQIEDYDPFAGAGCFGEAVGIETLQATLGLIKGQSG